MARWCSPPALTNCPALGYGHREATARLGWPHRRGADGGVLLDGKSVVTTSYDGTARVWDVASGRTLVTFTGHAPGGHANRVALPPTANGGHQRRRSDGAHLGSAYRQRAPGPARPHRPLAGVAFSPDGNGCSRQLGRDRAAVDVVTGKELRRFVGMSAMCTARHSRPTVRRCSRVEQTGRRACGCHDREELRRFSGHTDELRMVAFSPDGRSILTASHDHTARLWPIDAGTPVP